jgi:lipopolysaccharide transport system ATP-binding protein
MSDIAIRFFDISKQYRLGLVSTKTISHDLNRWWQTSVLRKEDPYLKIGETNDRSKKGKSEYVWALQDVTFEVKKGDVLGIIGKNGAGKSTLLKILSRITTPTTGIIEAEGRIASLLEVGTGFHPELTGRENIYMNGAILGMKQKEIDRKLDEIVDFSGVERYLDTPIKRYSSGMIVRLGFSVAAHLEPEILVIDEVLAVGDAEFQKKAIGKIQDVSQKEERTVLFVSHNMASLQNLCEKGILLENGQVTFQSTIDAVIEKYVSSHLLESKIIFDEKTKRRGSRKTQFISIRLINPFSGQETSYFKMGEDIIVELQLHAFTPVNNLNVIIGMSNYQNVNITVWQMKDFCDEKRKLGKGYHTIYLHIKQLNVFSGFYNLDLSLFDGMEGLDLIREAICFEIIPSLIPAFNNRIVMKKNTLIYTPCDWTFN